LAAESASANVSYGKPLFSDIPDLQKDWPKSGAEGEGMLHGGH
jgi:hypothetical protein